LFIVVDWAIEYKKGNTVGVNKAKATKKYKVSRHPPRPFRDRYNYQNANVIAQGRRQKWYKPSTKGE